MSTNQPQNLSYATQQEALERYQLPDVVLRRTAELLEAVAALEAVAPQPEVVTVPAPIEVKPVIEAAPVALPTEATLVNEPTPVINADNDLDVAAIQASVQEAFGTSTTQTAIIENATNGEYTLGA